MTDGLIPSCDHTRGCITCGDEAIRMRVLRIDAGTGARALRRPRKAGERSTVEIALVQPVSEGDVLLVHAGTAIAHAEARWRHDDEVHGRVPRRGARPGPRRQDPRRRRAGPPLQGDGGLRRPHALHLQVRDRRPPPGERRAGPRSRLSRLRDPHGPRRRRDRDGDRERHHLHLLRRHDAGAGLGEDAHRSQGRRGRYPDGLLAARRAPAGQAEPRPRGGLLRDRVRDHRARRPR